MRRLGNKRISCQRIIVILLGIVFSILTLELGLRLGSLLLISFQEYSNRISFYKKGTYRIMCLGESTTLRQYPPFLEDILNQCNIGIKFSVIDKGVIETNTAAILLSLEENLNKYKPDMVVTMMGENDKDIMYYKDIPEVATKLFQYCRTYRCMRLIYTHILNRLKGRGIYGLINRAGSRRRAELKKIETITEDNLFSSEESLKKTIELNLRNDGAYVELGKLYLHQAKLSEAEELFKKAIELNPKNDRAYSELGWLYRHEGKILEAEESLKKAIELNPKSYSALSRLGDILRCEAKFSQAEESLKKAIELNPKGSFAYIALGWLYRCQGEESLKKTIESHTDKRAYGLGYHCQENDKFSQAEELFKKAIELSPGNVWGCDGLVGLYWKRGELSKAEEVLREFLAINPNNDWAHKNLESLYGEMNRIELAQEYKKRRDELRFNEYSTMTINNYRELKEILDRRAIRLVCVEYPVCSVEPLKKIFEGERGVVFVDNERVFKEALKRGSYTEYFRDLFGGDFGHCTPKGNRLLAENIANVILKEVFHK